MSDRKLRNRKGAVEKSNEDTVLTIDLNDLSKTEITDELAVVDTLELATIQELGLVKWIKCKFTVSLLL